MIGRALAGAALAGAALVAPAAASTPAPAAAIRASTHYVDPAFPGSDGTAAIPQRRNNRPLTLGDWLGDPKDGKHPKVEWDSRYTAVWKRPPLFRGFQSGAYNNRAMAVSVVGQCGERQTPGGSGGGDWKDPMVFIGSGGGPMNTKTVAKLKTPGFKCDGKPHLIIRQSDWTEVNAGYGDKFAAPYFDVYFPVDETSMVIIAEDDTWLHQITG